MVFHNIHIGLIRKLLGSLRAENFIKIMNIRMERSLFYFSVRHINKHMKHRKKIVYYEFGVGLRTLNNYLMGLETFSDDNHRSTENDEIVLFDSFKGLPSPENKKDINKLWKQGDFVTTVEDVKNSLKFDMNRVQFVEGLFKDSLTEELRNKLMDKKPDIITMDIDYYSSVKTVLEWLRPLLETGVVFYFDDVYVYFGNPVMGERAAINEFNAKGEGHIIHYPIISPHNCFVYSRY